MDVRAARTEKVDFLWMCGQHAGDPADRILVATARIEGATLVTRDGRIVQYSEQKTVKVLAV